MCNGDETQIIVEAIADTMIDFGGSSEWFAQLNVSDNICAEWCHNLPIHTFSTKGGNMKRRVVITGLGAITPIGNTVEEFWNGIKNGTVGIGPITKFDTTEYKVKIAAEVKDFVAKERMDFKASKRMETFSQYAVAAAKEACADAGFEIEKEDPYRCGVIIGSGIGSLQQIEKQYTTILEKGPGRVAPLMVPMMISNMAAGNVSIQLGLKGKCTNVVTACATGTNCIGDALRAIQYGDADVMFAGGTESCICPTGIAGFTALTALTTREDPLRASIPFDKDRSGFVLGEGAGEQEAQRFTQSLQVTGQPEMLTISLPQQKTEAVRQRRWSLRWKRAA